MYDYRLTPHPCQSFTSRMGGKSSRGLYPHAASNAHNYMQSKAT